MKTNLYFFMLLFIGSSLISCRKSDTVYGSDFEKSVKSWQNFKKVNNNSYRYMVSSSSWTGYSSQTTIFVKNGVVIQRSYVAKHIDYTTNQVVINEQWNETANDLNSHERGAASLTLDQIYEKAKTDWLLKRENVFTYFETKNSGMISTCGYAEKNCTDDCFRGIEIGFIESLIIAID